MTSNVCEQPEGIRDGQNHRLPSDWKERRIKDLSILRSGDFIDAEHIGPNGAFPVFGGNGIRGYTDGFTHEGRFVLIGRQGALCGNINYAEGRFWATEHAVVATLQEGLDVDWFGELLRSMHLNQHSNAAAQPGLAVERIKYLRLPVPPADEQKRIAAYLNACFGGIDDVLVKKRQQIELLSEFIKSTTQRVVTCGLVSGDEPRATRNDWLPYVPSGWSLVMLKRLCHIQSGLTLGKDYEGLLVERPYLRVANVQDGSLSLDNVSVIEVPASVAARTSLRKGDVLMTEGGDLDKLGRGVVWQGEIDDCLHQNHVFAVRCFDWKLRPQFLAYVSASQYGRDYFEATGKRTTNLAATNSTKVGQFPIPLPPLAEQDRLVEYLDGEAARIAQLRSLLEQQIAVLIAYRKSLIHECVTGQRRITDEDVNRVTAHAARLANA